MENAALRKAAEKADEQGDLNGKLDAKEFKIFALDAHNRGCEISDVLQVTGNAEEISDYAKTVSDIMAIEAKEKELERVESEIKSKKAEQKNIAKPSSKFNNIVKAVGAVLGAAAGFGATAGLSGFTLRVGARSRMIGKLDDLLFGYKKNSRVTIGVMVLGGAAAAFFGAKALVEKTNVFGLKPHEAKVAQKQEDIYKQNTVAPLEAKKEQIEEELTQMEEKLQ